MSVIAVCACAAVSTASLLTPRPSESTVLAEPDNAIDTWELVWLLPPPMYTSRLLLYCEDGRGAAAAGQSDVGRLPVDFTQQRLELVVQRRRLPENVPEADWVASVCS